eukprot:8778153-Lingulodinium_polyedra.AAC.1
MASSTENALGTIACSFTSRPPSVTPLGPRLSGPRVRPLRKTRPLRRCRRGNRAVRRKRTR